MKDDTNLFAQAFDLNLADIKAVQRNPSKLDIEETWNEVGDRCFSCPTWTDQCYYLTRSGLERDAVEYLPLPIITEINLLEA